MLHIILMILKIIGILLLSLLGLLLFTLLLILLVPIRYKVALEHGEAFDMEGRASWLLHFIHAKFTHHAGKPHIQIRIFGFLFYDSDKPRKTRAKKKKAFARNASKKRNQTNKNIQEPVTQYADTDSSELPTDRAQQLLSDTADDYDAEKQYHKYEDKSDIIGIDKALDDDDLRKDKKKRKRQPIFRRIIQKLCCLKEKLMAFVRSIKEKLIQFFQSVRNIKNKISLIYEFIQDEINREGFQVTYASLKKLLKHILPRKLQTIVVFGTGDPCSTGQVLGLLSILYSFYGDKIQITPDFEQARLEGKHDARGRIRLATILIIVIKLMLDIRFKRLKKNIQLLKEAL